MNLTLFLQQCVAGLMRQAERWGAMGCDVGRGTDATSGETKPKGMQWVWMRGHPGIDMLVYAFRNMMFQAGVSTWLSWQTMCLARQKSQFRAPNECNCETEGKNGSAHFNEFLGVQQKISQSRQRRYSSAAERLKHRRSSHSTH